LGRDVRTGAGCGESQRRVMMANRAGGRRDRKRPRGRPSRSLQGPV